MEELGSSGTANRWPGLMPSTADHCDDDDDGDDGDDGDDDDDGDNGNDCDYDMKIIFNMVIFVVLTPDGLGFRHTIVIMMMMRIILITNMIKSGLLYLFQI